MVWCCPLSDFTFYHSPVPLPALQPHWPSLCFLNTVKLLLASVSLHLLFSLLDHSPDGGMQSHGAKGLDTKRGMTAISLARNLPHGPFTSTLSLSDKMLSTSVFVSLSLSVCAQKHFCCLLESEY